MNIFIEKLAEACREHRIRQKWLIAPSLRVGHQWLDQVTRAGGPVLNVHVRTVRSLAMKVLASQLADGSLVVASPAVRRLVVAASWQRVMTDDGYLGSARLTPGLLAMAESSLLDLRLAGLGPDDLDAAGFDQPVKGAELRALLAAYQAELEARKLIDRADAARLATTQLRSGPAPEVIVLRPDDLELAVVEQTLLDAVTATAVVRLPVDDETAGPLQDDAVHIVHAVGEANEVRGVLRTCVADDIPLDTVELLYTAADPYVPLIYETALRLFDAAPGQDLDVPVTFADGVPARLSRPGRLLAAWYSWVHDGFPQVGLLRMLQAGLLRLPIDTDADPVNRAQVIRMLRSVGIGMGRDRYLRCIDEKIESIHAAGDSHRWRLDAARALRGLVEAVLAVSPDPGAGVVTTVSAARALNRDHANCSGRLDGLARQRLDQELAGMADALDGAAADPPGFDGWQWISELPRQITVGGSGPRPGQLHVASVRSGGHTGRTRTFIVGLDDGRFPSVSRQDPLLLDHERKRLSGRLSASTDRLREQVERFTGLLCRLRGDLTLSFSSRNIDDGRETFAGPVLLGCYRHVSGDHDGDHGALSAWLGPAISFAPRDADSCLDAGEWWLHHAASEVAVANLAALAAGSFAHLARGRDAAAARLSEAFTVYDGLVEEPGQELDPRNAEGPVLSATGYLQLIAGCPLKYFYRRVLGIKAPPDVEVDPEVWLTRMQFGVLVHEVLFDFVALLIDEDAWPPEPGRDLPRMAAIVEAKSVEERRRIPPPGEEAYRRQRVELDQTAEIFVNEQARRTKPGRPVYLEASIGYSSDHRVTDIDAPEPVEIDLPGGGVIRTGARIDRIDRDGHAYVIYDYKSGGYTKIYDPAVPFQKGRVVQHVLYMAVAKAALRAKVDPAAVVDEFRFLFPGVRTHGREITFASDLVKEGLEVIEKLCRLPADGVFPATDDVADCKFCDYRDACQAVAGNLEDLCRASGRKIDNPDNTLLAPFVELRRG